MSSRLEHHGRRSSHGLRGELKRRCAGEAHPDATVCEGFDQDEDVRRPAPADAGHGCTNVVGDKTQQPEISEKEGGSKSSVGAIVLVLVQC